MFFSVAMLPLFLFFSFVVDEPFPLFVPFITFIVGLTIMLYSRLFVEDFPSIKSQLGQPFGIGTPLVGQALPPASNIPMYGPGNLAGQQVRTNELAQRPSVTEHTTRLLDNE
jgi:hypothetical protein